MGEGEGRLLGSEGESADFQSEFRTRWSKEGESHEATGWVLKKKWQVGKMYFKFTSKYQIDSAAAAKTILFKCEQLLKNQFF